VVAGKGTGSGSVLLWLFGAASLARWSLSGTLSVSTITRSMSGLDPPSSK
jgi:hypothetical protein